MTIYLFLFGVLLSAGLFFIAADLLRLPTLATQKAILSSGKQTKEKPKTIDMLLRNAAIRLCHYIRMDEYKKKKPNGKCPVGSRIFRLTRTVYGNGNCQGDEYVITAIRVSGGQSDPDRPTRVSFNIGGRTYNVGNVYYPEGDSQLAWVKWKTPDTEQTLTIHVTVSGPGSTAKTTLNVKIVDLDKNSPPNPVADDRNDSYRIAAVPNRAIKSTANWSVWRPWWQEYWVWHGDDEDGYWCDHGWWEFDMDRYSASLTAAMRVTAAILLPAGGQ